MEFTTNEKSPCKLLKNGYMYLFQKMLADVVTSWECVHRRKGQCKARVRLTVMDQFIEKTNEHTHAPSQVGCQVTKVESGIKCKAETTNDSSHQILATNLDGITGTAAVNSPSLEKMRRNINAV